MVCCFPLTLAFSFRPGPCGFLQRKADLDLSTPVSHKARMTTYSPRRSPGHLPKAAKYFQGSGIFFTKDTMFVPSLFFTELEALNTVPACTADARPSAFASHAVLSYRSWRMRGYAGGVFLIRYARLAGGWPHIACCTEHADLFSSVEW